MEYRTGYLTPRTSLPPPEYPEFGIRLWHSLDEREWRVEAVHPEAQNADSLWATPVVPHAGFQLVFASREAAIEAGRILQVQLALEGQP